MGAYLFIQTISLNDFGKCFVNPHGVIQDNPNECKLTYATVSFFVLFKKLDSAIDSFSENGLCPAYISKQGLTGAPTPKLKVIKLYQSYCKFSFCSHF